MPFYVGGAAGMRNQGTYAAGTTYFPNDIVQYNGSSYIATAATIGNLPTNGSFWAVLSSAGSSGILPAAATVTVNSLATANSIQPVNASSGARTITLPATPVNGTAVGVKKLDNSANAVTVVPNGTPAGTTINGSTSVVLASQEASVELVYNSALNQWFVTSTAAPTVASNAITVTSAVSSSASAPSTGAYGAWQNTSGSTVESLAVRARSAIYPLSLNTADYSNYVPMTFDGKALNTTTAPNVLLIPMYATFYCQVQILLHPYNVTQRNWGVTYTFIAVRDSTSARIVGIAASNTITDGSGALGTPQVSIGSDGSNSFLRVAVVVSQSGIALLCQGTLLVTEISAYG